MKTHEITGGGGVHLHVVEAGNSKGYPILLLHGLSQCWLTWTRQMDSDLAEDFRLIAMDLRGHGLSDKPREGYTDSRLWADDLSAVIETLKLDKPVLCGWSYGPLVILDYIRHYGEDSISGLIFVGGVTKLGSNDAISVLTPEFLNLIPGFFSQDAEESVRSLASLLRLCFIRELLAEEFYLMLGWSVSVPPYVRQALLSRSFDNDDLLPKIRRPLLIAQGAEDAVVRPIAIDRHKACMRNPEIYMPNTGHAPFWDDATGFNRRLREFVNSARAA
ncbi:MAG TPA: alpha/beta hydrolase [Bryobacteraceae bacterium]|nr:alpha/beta hydrolase [Bryobacteraceae bacterium]